MPRCGLRQCKKVFLFTDTYLLFAKWHMRSFFYFRENKFIFPILIPTMTKVGIHPGCDTTKTAEHDFMVSENESVFPS